MADRALEERFNRELGAALCRARKAIGIKQNELSAMLGWVPTALCRIEQGHRISLRHYCAVTAALGIGPCNLLKLTAAIVANAD